MLMFTTFIGHDDYAPGPYFVTFISGIISVPFSVVIIDDNIQENNEHFNLTIDPSSLPNSVSVDVTDQLTVTIVDNDSE